jgi:hypothetical protein
MMFSANLNVSDHRVYFRLRPAMKRRNRTQQEGPRNREIATISITCNRARDWISKGTCKTCQYPKSLTFYPLSMSITMRSLVSGFGSYSVQSSLALSSSSPEECVVLGSYLLAQLDRLPEELLNLPSTTPRRLISARGPCCRHPDGRSL